MLCGDIVAVSVPGRTRRGSAVITVTENISAPAGVERLQLLPVTNRLWELSYLS